MWNESVEHNRTKVFLTFFTFEQLHVSMFTQFQYLVCLILLTAFLIASHCVGAEKMVGIDKLFNEACILRAAWKV